VSGDRPRAEALAAREVDALLAYFERRVAVRADAADLVGEALVVVWRRSADIPGDEREARMWLFGVARRVLATHRRGSRRHRALTDRLRGELSITGDDRSELSQRVRDAVRALPGRDRELVGLVHWEGFGLAEAAEILSIRPGAARMRYARARERLARTLGVEAAEGQSGSESDEKVP
jgi:RNA polymerase sigma-70 factor (ECF subfamily)